MKLSDKKLNLKIKTLDNKKSLQQKIYLKNFICITEKNIFSYWQLVFFVVYLKYIIYANVCIKLKEKP